MNRDAAQVERNRAHLHLAIEFDSDPIQGSVKVSDDPPRAFCGWVELAAAIEGVRARNLTPPLAPDCPAV